MCICFVQIVQLVCTLDVFEPPPLAHGIVPRIQSPTVSQKYTLQLVNFYAGYFSCFLSNADFFNNHLFENSIRNTIRVPNSLDPDQARYIVGPDLGPNGL